MILNAQDDPVMDDRITHGVTKITCVRECAKGRDINISAFMFLLISEVESVSLKGFMQFSDGEFVELLYYLRQVIFFVRTVGLKTVKNL